MILNHTTETKPEQMWIKIFETILIKRKLQPRKEKDTQIKIPPWTEQIKNNPLKNAIEKQLLMSIYCVAKI